MSKNLQITRLSDAYLQPAIKLFEVSVAEAFEQEGLGHLSEDIQGEILHKKHMLEEALINPKSEVFFLIAKLDEAVVGAISFGPCGEDIKKCMENKLAHIGELGSLFVLPAYQNQGIGSALIKAMMEQLHAMGVEEFCLDSGYKRAQKRWLQKFGSPCTIAKDYWGPGGDHMIWHCKVKEVLG